MADVENTVEDTKPVVAIGLLLSVERVPLLAPRAEVEEMTLDVEDKLAEDS